MRSSNTTEGRKIAIVVAAAGRSLRFSSDKLAETLADSTVLEASIARLSAALPGVPTIVVVGKSEIHRWRSVLSGVEVIAGGPRRQDSVRLGAERAMELGAETILIHDGARPLVHSDDVRRVVDALRDGDGAILCAEVTDAVKRIDEQGVISKAVDRSRLRLAQTPQVFRASALRAAWRAAEGEREFADEAELLEHGGLRVRCVPATHPNPKVTTAIDLELVRLLTGGA